MSNKLKPCPFCGEPCTTYTFYGGTPIEWGHCGYRFDSVEKWNHRPVEDAYRAEVRALVEAVTPYIIIDRCSNPIRERVPDVRYKEYWKLYDCGNCQYCRAKAALAALESDNE